MYVCRCMYVWYGHEDEMKWNKILGRERTYHLFAWGVAELDDSVRVTPQLDRPVEKVFVLAV